MVLIPEYILILALTIAVDYFAGIQIEKSRGRTKKFWLWSSVIVTCLILFFFKYLDFFWQTVGPNDRSKFGWLLPIGLSFHTFQSLSYVIEVYRGQQKAERHFGIYALYVLFFPQLVAGPIERPQNLLPQMRRRREFDVARVSSGLRLMLWGMFLKTVVADRLAVVVDFVYAGLKSAPPDAVLIAAIFFAFQIYADFQGYTSIARGAARVLGFELIPNFDRPYASASVTEFWRRWHMSLSSWFRDYVYIPLGGSRRGHARNFLNLMVTFTVSGLWHGANWTFVFWGALNGLFVAVERAFGFSENRLRPLKRVYAFVAILITWVFFRSANLTEGFFVVKQLPLGAWAFVSRVVSLRMDPEFFASLGVGPIEFAIAVLCVVLVESLQVFEKPDWGERMKFWAGPLRWMAYVAFTGFVIYSWMFFPQDKKPFIYFQF